MAPEDADFTHAVNIVNNVHNVNTNQAQFLSWILDFGFRISDLHFGFGFGFAFWI